MFQISCKIWETRKIFPIFHSPPYYNNYILRMGPSQIRFTFEISTFLIKWLTSPFPTESVGLSQFYIGEFNESDKSYWKQFLVLIFLWYPQHFLWVYIFHNLVKLWRHVNLQNLSSQYCYLRLYLVLIFKDSLFPLITEIFYSGYTQSHVFSLCLATS